ncbi:MAG TPA: hypothetical protein VFH42_07095 [Sporolactobacillaceae bacterium]|nr:hypothetical protein [Sporolactobacillaceae bacterium]
MIANDRSAPFINGYIRSKNDSSIVAEKPLLFAKKEAFRFGKLLPYVVE